MHATLDEVAWASPWRPRSVAERVGLTLGLALWGLLSPTWWAAAGVLALVLAIALGLAKVPWRTYGVSLSAPLAFITLGAVAVVVGFGHSADAFVRLGPLQVTPASLNTGATLLTRAFTVTAAVMLLASICPISEMLTGLRRLGLPTTLVDIASSMYRMIFVLLARAGAIRQAQVSRLGYSSAKAAMRSTGQLSATVFFSAWDQARRLEAGLEGRGGTDELVALRRPTAVSPSFVRWVIAANLLAASFAALGWWLR